MTSRTSQRSSAPDIAGFSMPITEWFIIFVDLAVVSIIHTQSGLRSHVPGFRPVRTAWPIGRENGFLERLTDSVHATPVPSNSS